jgi:hypothetical protein
LKRIDQTSEQMLEDVNQSWPELRAEKRHATGDPWANFQRRAL